MIEIEQSHAFAQLYADDPSAIGQVTACTHEQGFLCHAATRPDLTPEQADGFARWVERTLSQLSETGDPEANGWFRSGHQDERWHLTARVHDDLPAFD